MHCRNRKLVRLGEVSIYGSCRTLRQRYLPTYRPRGERVAVNLNLTRVIRTPYPSNLNPLQFRVKLEKEFRLENIVWTGTTGYGRPQRIGPNPHRIRCMEVSPGGVSRTRASVGGLTAPWGP